MKFLHKDLRAALQTWVDNSGSLLMLAGQLVDRSMVMSMTGPSPTEDWTVLFDGRYVRAR